ncbi:MAG: site-specific integrase [Eubacteriaceae bacterium]|nr:site-specific integrase [Eubacteriaceae bacterium]
MPVYKDEKKKGNKIWFVVVRYQDWQGKRKQKFKRGFATKREAQTWERQFLLKESLDIDMTLASFYELYKADVQPTVKNSTWRTKEHIVNTKILDFFGEKKMSEIKSRDIIQWQNKIRAMTGKNGEPYSQSYLKTVHAQLSAIFNHAVLYYDLSSNPVRKAGPMGNEDEVQIDFWTEEEYEKVSEEAMDDPINYYAMEVLYWTGIREGELLALTPEDINLENGLLYVNKTYTRIDGVDEITKPKTKKSNRVIKMPDFLVGEIRDCMDMYYDLKDTDRIFQGTSKKSLTNAKNKACRKAGVKQITIHEIRHSHASMLSNMGFPDNAVSERMGHETERMTQHYSHAYPKRQDEMADKMNKLRNRGEENVKEKS